MTYKHSWKNLLGAVAVIGVATVVTPGAQAQGGGGFQMPPEIQAKIKAWQKWRDTHKGISQLQTLMFQLRELDKDPANKLTKPQAKKVLGAIKPWRTKATMSDDQAKSVVKQISGDLTDKQLKKMSTFQPPWARMGGGGGGRPGGGFGGGRPGGGGPPGGGRPGGFTFPDPKDYNPLNPDTLPFEGMRPQAKKGMDDFMADLAKR